MVLLQGISLNKSGMPKMIDAQLHLANNLMFIIYIGISHSLSILPFKWPTSTNISMKIKSSLYPTLYFTIIVKSFRKLLFIRN